jgi:hypothetical protein
VPRLFSFSTQTAKLPTKSKPQSSWANFQWFRSLARWHFVSFDQDLSKLRIWSDLPKFAFFSAGWES